MVNVKVLAERPSVNNPDQVLIKGFTGESFCIRHCGMLKFNDDAGLCYDVGPVNLAVGRSVCDFATLFSKSAFPFPVPIGFVFPPGIAIFALRMRPVMDNPGTTFRYGCRTADRALSPPAGECFTPFRLYQRELQPEASNSLCVDMAQSDSIVLKVSIPVTNAVIGHPQCVGYSPLIKELAILGALDVCEKGAEWF